MLSENEITDRVRAIIKHLALHDAETVIEQSGRWLHILIASPDFEGKTASERENIIWREFEEQFDDETILAITQCYLLTPKERHALVPRTKPGPAGAVGRDVVPVARHAASNAKTVTGRNGKPIRQRQPRVAKTPQA